MALHHPLLIPMMVHVLWASVLYTALTVVRAPSIWGIGKNPDGTNPWAAIEPRISANLSNQFEWPVLFYAACILLIQQSLEGKAVLLLAWVFIVGRVIHSLVQVFTRNIRLRGAVFTINFLTVLGLWIVIANNL